MPFIDLTASPLAPAASPVRIHYRDAGRGSPLVFLHGGWGYEMYPFDRQIDALAGDHRVVIPDRSGYGASTPIEELPTDFHQRAADETRAVLDALDLQRPIVWGHSDGAIIALMLGLAAPQRIACAIVEAAHFYKRKPASSAFFAGALTRPGVVARHSRAWLRIGEEASATEDFYGGRLADVRVPVLVMHGAGDPRTEPGELGALRAALPRAQVFVHPEGGHSPHSERATADDVTRVARQFIDGCH